MAVSIYVPHLPGHGYRPDMSAKTEAAAWREITADKAFGTKNARQKAAEYGWSVARFDLAPVAAVPH